MYKYKFKNYITLLQNYSSLVFFKAYTKFLLTYFFKFEEIKKEKKSFLNYIKKKKLFFSQDWFSKHIYYWNNIFNQNLKNEPKKILEIGCFEGMSAVFFLKKFRKSKLHIVDTFGGSKEQVGIKDFSKLKKIFLNNIKEHLKRTKVFSMTSKKFLLKSNNEKYDLIYIDGSHFYKDVYFDGTHCIELLNKDGLLVFDDYFWKFYSGKRNPINAINRFHKINKKKIKLVGITSQIFFKKII